MIKGPEIYEGTLRIVGSRNSKIGRVHVPQTGSFVQIEGRSALNAALDGDHVRVEILK